MNLLNIVLAKGLENLKTVVKWFDWIWNIGDNWPSDPCVHRRTFYHYTRIPGVWIPYYNWFQDHWTAYKFLEKLTWCISRKFSYGLSRSENHFAIFGKIYVQTLNFTLYVFFIIMFVFMKISWISTCRPSKHLPFFVFYLIFA